MSGWSNAAIALGSNLGDSRHTLMFALETLARSPGLLLHAQSHLYQTAPVGPPQPDYINACALIRTQLDPLTLMRLLLQIEARFGRERRERWGARTLDLDLLLFNDLVFEHPTLQIPHPRMRDRAFVLVPLAEIAPDWIDPVSGKPIAELVQAVNCSGVRKLE